MIRFIITLSLGIFLIAIASYIIPEDIYSNNYLVEIAQEDTKQVTIEQTELTNRNHTDNNTLRVFLFQLPIIIIVGAFAIFFIRLANPQNINNLINVYTQHKLTQQEALKAIVMKNTSRMPLNSQKQPYMTIYSKKGHNVSNDR